MSLFIRTTGGRRARRSLLLLLFLFLTGSLLLGGCAPFVAATGETEAELPLTRAASPDNRAALTFDVTWGQEELIKILATLDTHQVKATFFVGGTFLTLQGETVKQLAARGHEIGTLGQKIADLSSLPEQEITSNLLASQSSLSKLLGGPVRYFRTPQGPATPGVVKAARQANLITVSYSLDSYDQMGRRPDEITARVVRNAQKGDIILLSASDWSRDTNRALPAIIKGLRERGFKLVRLSELVPPALQP
jgi:peptidoglycan-N-acetylglucosamine deacetylase